MTMRRVLGYLLIAASMGGVLAHGQTKKAAPAPATKTAAPAKPAAAAKPTGAAAAAHPNATAGGANRTASTGTAGHPGTGNTTARTNASSVTHGPGGTTTVHTADNREFTKAPNGHVESFKGAHGEEAHFGHDGRVQQIHSGNMNIQHGPGGVRHVEMERPDHSRLVSDGRGHGYVQRPYQFHGHAYDHREYYVNGVRYSRFYHPYYYHGVYLNGYVPGVYYAPAFYGWAYSPWPQPYPYAWGWGASPWYGYYGAYFTPYPVYAAPSLWLTDYMMSQQLQAAYQAGVAAGASGAVGQLNHPSGGAHLVYASYEPAQASKPVALTPAIKKMISDEVQAYLTAESSVAKTSGEDGPGGLDKLLSDGKPHVFVAGAALTVSPSSGDCGLTEGDVVQATGTPAADAATLNVTVLASKASDCSAGSAVPVKLDDLQEMQNSMMANVDQGLAELKAHPGQGGLPAPPAAALTSQTAAPYAAAAPAGDDANVGQELQQADQQASQTEQQVLAEATPPAEAGSPAGAATPAAAATNQAAPATIALGQTTTDVALNRGKPKQIVNLGPKAIWVYDDMKIIFINGKVSDVQ